MRLATLGLLLGLVAGSAPAVAESAGEAMQAFGLVGTWASDCAVDINRPCNPSAGNCARRSTYVLPLLGNPHIENVASSPRGGARSPSLIEIMGATRVSAEKIKLVEVWHSDPKTIELYQTTPTLAWQKWPEEQWEIVISKIDGTHVRVTSASRVDGKKILIAEGFFYEPADYSAQRDLNTPWLNNTGKETPTLEKCLN